MPKHIKSDLLCQAIYPQGILISLINIMPINWLNHNLWETITNMEISLIENTSTVLNHIWKNKM